MRFLVSTLVLGGLWLYPVAAHAAIMAGGFTFSDQAFADVVAAFEIGDPAPTRPTALDPAAALGAPDAGIAAAPGVALGNGGSLTIAFTDNRLTGNGSVDPDLVIFEGGAPEATFIELSVDGITFFDAGSSEGGTVALDIDAALVREGLSMLTQIAFVRLTDDPSQGSTNSSTAGADIDAIGALTSVPADPIPVPGAAILFGSAIGLGRMRKTLLRQ